MDEKTATEVVGVDAEEHHHQAYLRQDNMEEIVIVMPYYVGIKYMWSRRKINNQDARQVARYQDY